jgi:ppGpp synthetase/RelA/SpoT-type nucleotidyltranferase
MSEQDWVAAHVPRFSQVRGSYAGYAQFLEAVLKAACRKLAPLAVVTGRPKGIASFAEKIIRKHKIYADPKDPQPADPLVRLTDLCGARVIAQTAGQVTAVCQFIEQAFDIDRSNSEDVSQRLKPTEFGYRSVHYIVQVNPAKLKAAGIELPVPRVLLGPVCPDHPSPTRLKAEIQVRTLLEHASADIAHDLIYKADVKLPAQVRRQYAALAAVLEGADREFGRLLAALDDFKSHFGAWHHPDEVQREIDRLRIVLKCDARNEGLAIRIGQLALAIGQHQTALEVLRPFDAGHSQGVQRIRGIALTELHWDAPTSRQFKQGVRLLELACSHSATDAETFCALAECHAHCDEDERAGEVFGRAIRVDPTEPLSFCRFLEFEIAHHRNADLIKLTEPMIRQAMDRCQKEIQAGVNLPVAWSCLAIFQLLQQQPFAAVESLAQVLALCGKPAQDVAPSPQPCAAGRVLRRTQATLRHLGCIREKLAGFDWFERLLLLALATLMKDSDARDELRAFSSWPAGSTPFNDADQVVILSGACASPMQAAVDTLRPHLLRAVKGMRFTLLGGGTRMGISGLAGEVAQHSRGRIRAFGYLPGRLPAGMVADKSRYHALIESKGTDFTPLEPLQGWTDLAAAGVEPRQVKLLSYAGGRISRVEYAVALALGARVGMIDSRSIPEERRFRNPLWESHPRLLRLPLDAMTVRAFLKMHTADLPVAEQKQLASAARLAHEHYTRSSTPQDPSLKPWEELDETLRRSNYAQVAYWLAALRDEGLVVRPLTKHDEKRAPMDLEKAIGRPGVRRLAEAEHGRWNVERLSYGWRFAEEKDVTRKLSPFLIPWSDVPPQIQKHDVNAIRNLPKKMRSAGLEICKSKG